MRPKSVDISELFSELQLTSNDDPAAQAIIDQRLEILQNSLRQLPPKISTTLMLHRFAGLSIEEIGVHLGVARPTAKKYLARALSHVRDAELQADKDAR
jgi:RNA polymerase sigma factor (sigma-70 family)